MIDAAGKYGRYSGCATCGGAVRCWEPPFPVKPWIKLRHAEKRCSGSDARNSVTNPVWTYRGGWNRHSLLRLCFETGKSFGSGSAAGNITVTAANGCTWSAMSNAPNWLTVTSGSSGKGNGVVSYALMENHAAFPRTGVLFVAGNT